MPVEKVDILIFASDGLSDNLWDEEVLDQVVRFRRGFFVDSNSQEVDGSKTEGEALNTGTEEVDKTKATLQPETTATVPGGGVKRKTLTGLLSEALCSRARRVSERRGSIPIPILRCTRETGTCHPQSVHLSSTLPIIEHDDDEIPFSRRAREAGSRFTGGKKDGEYFSPFSSLFVSFLFVFERFCLLRLFEPAHSLFKHSLSLSSSVPPLSLCLLSLAGFFLFFILPSLPSLTSPPDRLPVFLFYRSSFRVSIQRLTCSIGNRYLCDCHCHLAFKVAGFIA